MSIVWRVETVLQLANWHHPDSALSAHAALHGTGHFKIYVWGAHCVAVRCQQNITLETKISLHAVHNCVGPYSAVCVCVCACSVGSVLMVGQCKQIWLKPDKGIWTQQIYFNIQSDIVQYTATHSQQGLSSLKLEWFCQMQGMCSFY